MAREPHLPLRCSHVTGTTSQMSDSEAQASSLASTLPFPHPLSPKLLPTLFNISQVPPPLSSSGLPRSLGSPLLLPCLESCPSSNPFSILQLINQLPPLYSKTSNVAQISSRYSLNFIAQLTNPLRVRPLFCPSYCSLLIFSLCLTVSPHVSHHTHNLCSCQTELLAIP